MAVDDFGFPLALPGGAVAARDDETDAADRREHQPDEERRPGWHGRASSGAAGFDAGGERTEDRESRPRLLEAIQAVAGELVVTARRALFGLREARRLPARARQPVQLEAAEDGVDGAAGQAGGVEDVEPVARPAVERVEDEGGCGGERARHETHATYV